MYLQATRSLPLILEDDNSGNARWYVDAAFAVHHDMRSHTGIYLSTGKGATYAASRKQKLTGKSSTEAELIAIDDCASQILWTKYFLKDQGYHLNNSTLYQDNQSTMLLAENGKSSSTKRTRHINIRYFFITDCINWGNIAINYMPTEEMIADFSQNH